MKNNTGNCGWCCALFGNKPSNGTKTRINGSQVLTGPQTTRAPDITAFRLITGVLQ